MDEEKKESGVASLILSEGGQISIGSLVVGALAMYLYFRIAKNSPPIEIETRIRAWLRGE